MKSYFEEIFEYQNKVNQDMLTQIAEIEQDIPTKVIDLFSHSINAHKLWNNRILSKSEKVEFITYRIEDLLVMDIENFKDMLQILMKKDLNERINYNSLSGKAYHNSIQEILTQLSQHFQYHRGQIVTEMLKHNLKLKPTDYIYYTRIEA